MAQQTSGGKGVIAAEGRDGEVSPFFEKLQAATPLPLPRGKGPGLALGQPPLLSPCQLPTQRDSTWGPRRNQTQSEKY